MKISNRRFRKIRKIRNQTRKKNKSQKRRKRKSGKKRSFRRKNYVNLRLQTLKRYEGGGWFSRGKKKPKSAQKPTLEQQMTTTEALIAKIDKAITDLNSNNKSLWTKFDKKYKLVKKLGKSSKVLTKERKSAIVNATKVGTLARKREVRWFLNLEKKKKGIISQFRQLKGNKKRAQRELDKLVVQSAEEANKRTDELNAAFPGDQDISLTPADLAELQTSFTSSSSPPTSSTSSTSPSLSSPQSSQDLAAARRVGGDDGTGTGLWLQTPDGRPNPGGISPSVLTGKQRTAKRKKKRKNKEKGGLLRLRNTRRNRNSSMRNFQKWMRKPKEGSKKSKSSAPPFDVRGVDVRDTQTGKVLSAAALKAVVATKAAAASRLAVVAAAHLPRQYNFLKIYLQGILKSTIFTQEAAEGDQLANSSALYSIVEDLKYLGLGNFLGSWFPLSNQKFTKDINLKQGQKIAKAKIKELLHIIEQKSNSKTAAENFEWMFSTKGASQTFNMQKLCKMLEISKSQEHTIEGLQRHEDWRGEEGGPPPSPEESSHLFSPQEALDEAQKRRALDEARIPTATARKVGEDVGPQPSYAKATAAAGVTLDAATKSHKVSVANTKKAVTKDRRARKEAEQALNKVQSAEEKEKKLQKFAETLQAKTYGRGGKATRRDQQVVKAAKKNAAAAKEKTKKLRMIATQKQKDARIAATTLEAARKTQDQASAQKKAATEKKAAAEKKAALAQKKVAAAQKKAAVAQKKAAADADVAQKKAEAAQKKAAAAAVPVDTAVASSVASSVPIPIGVVVAPLQSDALPPSAAKSAAASAQGAGEVVVRIRIPQSSRARALLPPSVSVVNAAQDNAEDATIRISESAHGAPTV